MLLLYIRTKMKLLIIFGLFTFVFGNIDEKIVGGQETTIEDAPYQVSLRYLNQHICGASIIDRRTAVTAAHCVYNRRWYMFEMSVRVGSTTINDNIIGEVYPLLYFITHELFNISTLRNDIAILKLMLPLKFTSRIRYIELQSKGVAVPAGTTAVVSGWGATKENEWPMLTPRRLHKVSVDVIPRNACRIEYGKLITTNMICAELAGKDSCQGDSGGPLVAQNKLIGIVSFGVGCATPGFSGVYTEISAYRSWIEKHRKILHIW